MSNPLKSKNFKKIITIAAVAAITYGVGSAVMAASAAGTAGAGAGVGSLAAAESAGMASANAAATGAATSGGMAAGIDAGVNAALPEVAKTVVTDNLGKQAAGGFLSSMMENPMVQYGLVQTGGAMLQGAMQPDTSQSTNSGYAKRDFSQANPYQQQGQVTGAAPNNTMPVYNQETKRWES